jgi:DNA-binding NarL/FixJ family response regulator
MIPAPDHGCVRGLILKADRFYAEALRRAACGALPTVSFTVVNRIGAAADELARQPVDVLLCGVGMLDGDIFELLEQCMHAPRLATHVMVVTGRREQQVLATLQALQVRGVFDAMAEEPENFSPALRAIMEGKTYWSPGLLSRLPKKHSATKSGIDALTPTERLVFAVIGDGCDDAAAAGRLDLSVFSVQSVRREIHRKLGVQHKGELVRLAAQYGFVCLAGETVIRPGLSLLKAARDARRAQRNADLADSAGSEDALPASKSALILG